MHIGAYQNMKTVYEILYGSRCYGTATKDADIDIRGILLPTIEESLSMTEFKDIRYEKENKKGIIEDVVMYPIQKFFRLAVKSNPSVFEWLFVSDKHIRIMEPAGKMIRDNRLMFLSKEIYPRFKGFAYNEFSSLTKLTGKTGEKRRKEILKFGYSPKNASNCIRLLQQGIELLETANLIMPRPNCEELKEIKMGKWDYKQITNTFDNLLKDLDKALKKSKLPDKPRFEDTDNLLVRIIKEFN